MFANNLGHRGSILGRVIPITQKIVLDASLSKTQYYKIQIKSKCFSRRTRVAHPLQCSSNWKRRLWVAVDYGHLTYVGPSISFQTFFVQAFKIVVNSWKFTMLLLYIVWDDWPIFMISSLNQQLQQQLEYTLLKPDCHSWWISKI